MARNLTAPSGRASSVGNRRSCRRRRHETKRKHETNCVEVEDDTPVATLDISDDEVNRKMKTMTTTTTTTKTTEMATTRKGTAVAMRTK